MVEGHSSPEIRVMKMYILLYFLMSSLLVVLCRVCWLSYVESAGCLMSSLLGVLCRVCWVSYVESAGCLV